MKKQDAIWTFFRAVAAIGDAWFYEPTIGRDEALAYALQRSDEK